MRNIHQYSRYLGLALLLLLTGAFAQSDSDTPAQENPQFSQQELDQMLAPIALYPDALLSQVLMAATYPLEVVEAARWSRDNAGMKDREAVDAVGEKDWDPSVKSLVAFPQVLAVMDDKIEWTERLGDAFLAQQPQVMDTVQSLRRKAQSAGNLRTNAQVDVQQDGEDVEIAPVNAEVAFVPYYDPSVVYGPWWWPDYQPVLWGPWAGYDWNGGLHGASGSASAPTSFLDPGIGPAITFMFATTVMGFRLADATGNLCPAGRGSTIPIIGVACPIAMARCSASSAMRGRPTHGLDIADGKGPQFPGRRQRRAPRRRLRAASGAMRSRTRRCVANRSPSRIPTHSRTSDVARRYAASVSADVRASRERRHGRPQHRGRRRRIVVVDGRPQDRGGISI